MSGTPGGTEVTPQLAAALAAFRDNRGVPKEVVPAVEVPQLAAQATHAFSSPLRLAILHVLREEPLTAAELGRRLELSKQTVSRNITALRDAGILPPAEDPPRRDVPLVLNRERLAMLAGALLAYLGIG